MAAIENPKSLYIGCCLTGAPEEFTGQVEELKDSLRQNYEVFDFVGLTAGTAEDVYRWDIDHCVADCDMFVSVCDHPSIGLGWELSESVRMNKPTLAVAHENARVTRLVLGAAALKPNLSFERYQDMVADVPRLIEVKFQAVEGYLQQP
jgi:hypothetical protein